MMRLDADGGIEFRLDAPTARVVEITLDFGGGRIRTLAMRRDGRGRWILRLHPGLSCLRYRFRIDGRPVADPDAMFEPAGDGGMRIPLSDGWRPVRRAA